MSPSATDSRDDPATAADTLPAHEETVDRVSSQRPFFGIRTKIILSFSLVFSLCAGVSFWSIWIVSDLDDRIRFLEVSGNFLHEIQQVRRFEKNYLLYATNYKDSLLHLENAERILGRHTATIAKVLGRERLRTMTEYVADYHTKLDELAGAADDAQRESTVALLRDDGAEMVSFAEDFVQSERGIVESRLTLARRVPLFFLLALLVLICFVVAWLTRQLLFTLKRFMVYTERISTGDFSPIVPVRRYKDEFSKLADAINRMVREIDRRQEILVESHKLRAIGTLIAGVAHELNNPLNNTMLSSEVLKEDLETMSDDEKREIIDDVLSETERAQKIVRNLLDFARESTTSNTSLDLERIVTESVRLVANQVRMARLKLHTVFDPDLPLVHGDEQLLKQVLVNLLLNAVDALPPGGRIDVLVHKQREEGFVTTEVRDNGPGIPHHIQQRIFEPFFTTKGRGQGTGLGLSVSQGIVEKLGGVLRCQSREGEGTSFLLSLPVTHAPSEFMGMEP